MLIDVFVNAIFLYDDKMLITFNYKEGTKSSIFDDIKNEVSEETFGSDLDCRGAPKNDKFRLVVFSVIFAAGRLLFHRMRASSIYGNFRRI